MAPTSLHATTLAQVYAILRAAAQRAQALSHIDDKMSERFEITAERS